VFVLVGSKIGGALGKVFGGGAYYLTYGPLSFVAFTAPSWLLKKTFTRPKKDAAGNVIGRELRPTVKGAMLIGGVLVVGAFGLHKAFPERSAKIRKAVSDEAAAAVTETKQAIRNAKWYKEMNKELEKQKKAGGKTWEETKKWAQDFPLLK
jgi:hypothetical protein